MPRTRESDGETLFNIELRPILNITPLFIRQSSFLSIVHYSYVIWTACVALSHLLRLHFHMLGSTKQGIHLICWERGWERRRSGGGINSSLFAPFISLSKGNAFIDVIIGGTDEMIKMEMNCHFEQTQHSSGTQRDRVGRKKCLGVLWVGGNFKKIDV